MHVQNPYRFGGGNGFDPDYQAVLDYATANSITKPSIGQQILQNQLVLALKSYRILVKRDAFYMNVNYASLEFSCLNWIDPSLYAKDPLLWSWTSNIGLEKASSTGDTIGYVPSTD